MPNTTPPAPASRPGKIAPDDRPPINAEWLTRMREQKPEFLRRLFDVFQAEEPQRLALLVQATLMGDLEQTRFLAHSLKGGAATLGMERLRDACRELEFAARDGDTAAMAQRLVPVTREMEAVFLAMRTALAPV